MKKLTILLSVMAILAFFSTANAAVISYSDSVNFTSAGFQSVSAGSGGYASQPANESHLLSVDLFDSNLGTLDSVVDTVSFNIQADGFDLTFSGALPSMSMFTMAYATSTMISNFNGVGNASYLSGNRYSGNGGFFRIDHIGNYFDPDNIDTSISQVWDSSIEGVTDLSGFIGSGSDSVNFELDTNLILDTSMLISSGLLATLSYSNITVTADWTRVYDYSDPNTGGTIPEPASLALMLGGLAGFGFIRRKRVGA